MSKIPFEGLNFGNYKSPLQVREKYRLLIHLRKVKPIGKPKSTVRSDTSKSFTSNRLETHLKKSKMPKRNKQLKNSFVNQMN